MNNALTNSMKTVFLLIVILSINFPYKHHAQSISNVKNEANYEINIGAEYSKYGIVGGIGYNYYISKYSILTPEFDIIYGMPFIIGTLRFKIPILGSSFLFPQGGVGVFPVGNSLVIGFNISYNLPITKKNIFIETKYILFEKHYRIYDSNSPVFFMIGLEL